MSYTLLDSYTPKAAKNHRCIWCGQVIPKGEKYVREKSIFDGEFQDHKFHQECLPACIEYCKDSIDGMFDPGMGNRPKPTPPESPEA